MAFDKECAERRLTTLKQAAKDLAQIESSLRAANVKNMKVLTGLESLRIIFADHINQVKYSITKRNHKEQNKNRNALRKLKQQTREY